MVVTLTPTPLSVLPLYLSLARRNLTTVSVFHWGRRSTAATTAAVASVREVLVELSKLFSKSATLFEKSTILLPFRFCVPSALCVGHSAKIATSAQSSSAETAGQVFLRRRHRVLPTSIGVLPQLRIDLEAICEPFAFER